MRGVCARFVVRSTPDHEGDDSALSRELIDVLASFGAAAKSTRFHAVDDADRLLGALDGIPQLEQVWWSARLISFFAAIEATDLPLVRYAVRMMAYRMFQNCQAPAANLIRTRDWAALAPLMALVAKHIHFAEMPFPEPAIPLWEGWALEGIGDTAGALRAFREAERQAHTVLGLDDIDAQTRDAVKTNLRQSEAGLVRLERARE